MKFYSITNALLGCIGTASAAQYASVDVDTWCITYLSTYLVPVSIESGTGDKSSVFPESTRVSTILDSTTELSTAAFPTSSGIVVPTGRSIILRIEESRNQKRDTGENIRGGFVGPGDPDICTFAAVFTLADDQLYDDGVPRFYSGEDYKMLLGQGGMEPPMRGSITRTFETNDRILVFRNSSLPNGEAGFCQDSNGQVYITFTDLPLDSSQCQNGQLIGAETSTTLGAVTETSTKEGVRSESTNSQEFTTEITNIAIFIKFFPELPDYVYRVEYRDIAIYWGGSFEFGREHGIWVNFYSLNYIDRLNLTTTLVWDNYISYTSTGEITTTTNSETTTDTTSGFSSETTETSTGISSAVAETTQDTSMTTSESSTEIDTSTTEVITTSSPATTTTTLQLTTSIISSETTAETTAGVTTTSGPPPDPSSCAGTSDPYTYQDVSFDISCNSAVTGGVSFNSVTANNFQQCVQFCADYAPCVAIQFTRSDNSCVGFSSFSGTTGNSGSDVAIQPTDSTTTTATA
ncbi:hypothetical protein FSPOR_9946 [Fusarium sporotrichioides]|uniref:DUF7908 domain-containing protein n=1 Tax=Fusarium sporotrichioides TaxID=5514 RepID=A0A395RNA9_FUSSP|nr:hypothetical protein FSPOR_9946 [Fusarium sporotrichioides]